MNKKLLESQKLGRVIRDNKKFKKDIRNIIADYMQSEGCSCCQDEYEHNKNYKLLAKMLNVKKYKDGSGYDFNRYATNPV